MIPMTYVIKVIPVKLVNSLEGSDFFFFTAEWWCNGRRIFSWSSELVGSKGLPYTHDFEPRRLPAPLPLVEEEEKPKKKLRPDGGSIPS